jgi:hypothetical protein
MLRERSQIPNRRSLAAFAAESTGRVAPGCDDSLVIMRAVVARFTGSNWRWWAGLRALVLLLWLVAAATNWWIAPRQSTYEQARADIAAGRVAAYQWGDRWENHNSRWWFPDTTMRSSGTLGPLFTWQTGDGRVHWTDSGDFEQVTRTGTVDEKNYAGVGAVGLGQDLLAAGLEGRSGDLDPLGGIIIGVGTVLVLTFLGVLLAGPEPVLGTRWFWFWLVCTAPYGLGLLFWTVRDRPWTRAEPPVPEGGRTPRRDRGFLGLCIGVLSTMVISLLLFALNAVLGDRWIPTT